VILIYLIFVIFLFYWLIRKVRLGNLSKRKAVLLHAIYAISPTILYGLVFAALIASEAVMKNAIIGEGYARTFIFVMAGGLSVAIASTIIFTVIVLMVKASDSA
jgi:hypothetical protein